jgi:flavodoxin
MRSIIIVDSYHHNNTLKIANAFAKVLDCKVISPKQAEEEDLKPYELIGFGSGIDSGRHYKPLLDLAGCLSDVRAKPAFVFSTSAIQGHSKVEKDHSVLREKLKSKGYVIAGEFSCKGYNTNSFLKFTGGMNVGKPDDQDVRDAEEFATALLSSYPVLMYQVK